MMVRISLKGILRMAMNLKKGQKLDLTKGQPGLSRLLIGLGWDAGTETDLDTAAFLLGTDGKVSGDADFVFYGNLRHPSGSVEHTGDHRTGGAGGDAEQIRVELSAVPASVERIAFTATIYDAETRGQNFGQIRNAYIRVVDEAHQQELLRYDLGTEFSVETAVVVGEIYRYKGEWKFNAIGSGYKGGLAALCASFGVDVGEGQEEGNRASLATSPSQEKPKPVMSPTGVKKVELRKGQKVNLTKGTGVKLGEISINLNWHQEPKKSGGFLGSILGGRKGIDLDLSCLFELTDGTKGAVQALGNNFGSLQQMPYIALDADDRTGNSANGETMRVNGAMVSRIRRILVFTLIYEGVANWQEADGVVTVKCTGSPDIVVRMDEYGSSQRVCAIALLENTGNGTFSVEKVVQFFHDAEEMDKAFHWGLRWRTGSKD